MPRADVEDHYVVLTREIDSLAAKLTDAEARELLAVAKPRIEFCLTQIAVELDARLERERENNGMSMEVMANAIAHDIRQPLSAMAANGSAALRWLNRTPPDHVEARAALTNIAGAARRANEVLDGFQASLRTAGRKAEAIDINEITLAALRSLRGELSDHAVTVHAELASEPPLIAGDRVQLQQVICNLAHNAMDAMEAITDRPRMLWVRTEVHGPDRVGVTVEDSGPGIDSDRINEIFDPFVTTKAAGMGLGLAVSRMIIERHGGQLSATSGAGSGARFQFVLPVALDVASGSGTTTG